MNDLNVGDMIVGPDGKATSITDVYDVHIPDRMYELTMQNGEVIKCSGNHLWYSESDSDRKGRRRYAKLAKRYFTKNKIPQIDKQYPEVSLEVMVELLGGEKWENEFITKVCQSQGPVSMVPQEYYEDDLSSPVAKNTTYLFSYNDVILFLKRMRDRVILRKSEYFYFGKVRTTDDIFSIIDENINIPEKGDLN